MVNSKLENQLYFKANLAFEACKQAVKMFEAYLATAGTGAMPDYYKARTFLRDAEKFYQETLGEAKKLLGPLPPYASAEFEKWRFDFLSQHKILVESEEFAALKEELAQNGHIVRWIDSADLDRLLAKDYESQKIGKRKMANIKVRILLDRLQELMIRANELKKRAMEKLQKGV
jgi:enamine deaminase RidA (YjgF/YER057c/UK114 family)